MALINLYFDLYKLKSDVKTLINFKQILDASLIFLKCLLLHLKHSKIHYN